MSITIKTQFSSASLFVMTLIALPVVFAADGDLGESSTGRIYITLEIGAGELSQLSPAVAAELQDTSSTSFPICITYVDSQFVNVSVTELEQGGFNLVGEDGQVIPYQISLGSNTGEAGEEAKVKAINNTACGEDSALDVTVSLLPGPGQVVPASINGKFSFLIKSE